MFKPFQPQSRHQQLLLAAHMRRVIPHETWDQLWLGPRPSHPGAILAGRIGQVVRHRLKAHVAELRIKIQQPHHFHPGREVGERNQMLFTMFQTCFTMFHMAPSLTFESFGLFGSN